MFSALMAGMSTEQLQGQPAAWKGTNRAGVAFGQMAKLAKKLPGRLAYEVEKQAFRA